MSEATDKAIRLNKVAREFNLGLHTVVEFLEGKGHSVEPNPNTKIPGEWYALLQAEFGKDKEIKEASRLVVEQRQERETIVLVGGQVKEASKPKDEEEVVVIHNVPAEAPPAPAPPAPVAPAAPIAAAPEPVVEAVPEVPKEESKPEVAAPEVEQAVASASDVIKAKASTAGVKVVDRIDLDALKGRKGPKAAAPAAAKTAPAKPKEEAKPAPKPAAPAPVQAAAPAPPVAPPAAPAAPVAAAPAVPTRPAEPETIRVSVQKLAGLKTLGKIQLPVERERKPSDRGSAAERGRRKRIVKPGPVNVERTVQQEQRTPPPGGGSGPRPGELDENAVKRKVSETLARLTSSTRTGR